MEFAEKSPVFERAVDVLAEVSADDYNRMVYEARLKISLSEAKKKLGLE